MDKNKCSSCGEAPHKCSCKNKDFTKAVIEIDNPEQITLMRKVVIPVSMGDDTTVPPVVGKYHNVLLYYEANQKSYLYSSDGIPTQLVNGVTDYEAAVNLPQINGNTLIGNKTGEELGLQDKLTAGDNITIENDVISATDTTYGPATDSEIGLVKPGDGLSVDTDGTLGINAGDGLGIDSGNDLNINVGEGVGVDSSDNLYAIKYTFDTVADMKASTDLKAGDYARTGGFYTVNDGGGALYKITDTGTANEMDVIAIGSALYANLISDDTVNILQLGAKANDENYDNQPHLQRAFDLKKTTIIGDNVDDIFWVQSASRFYNSIIFNSWLKNKGSQGREIDRVIYIENVWSDKTIEVINPLIDGNRDTSKSYEGYNDDEYGHGINIRSSQNIKIIGGKIIKCYGDSLAISTSNLPEATRYYSNNILVENVYMDDAYRNTISIISGTNVTIRDCETYNRNGYRDILVEPNEDNRLKNENIVIDGGYHYSNGHTAVIDYCSNRKISNVKVSNCTIENGVNVTCPIRTSNNTTYKTENAIFESITFANHHTSTQILMGFGGNVEVKNCKIIGDSNIAYFLITTPTGDVVVDNLYVDVKDNENNSKNFSITMRAENGVIRFSNNIILSKNSSSSYSTQVTAIQAKLVYFVNNYLYKSANPFGIGDIGEETQTHDYPTNCVYMIDNYVRALEDYPTSRAIIVQYSADVTSLYSNYNFYDGITTKYVLWGDVTNTIGDAFI